jgi:hypothetical protein
MFDIDEPKTLSEQVKELLLVLTVQPVVCGLVNAIGFRLADILEPSALAAVVRLAAFTTTGAFLAMDLAAAGACVLVLRGEQVPELKPLAKVALPLNTAVAAALAIAYFCGGWRANAAAAACGLAAMFLALLLPVRTAPPENGK